MIDATYATQRTGDEAALVTDATHSTQLTGDETASAALHIVQDNAVNILIEIRACRSRLLRLRHAALQHVLQAMPYAGAFLRCLKRHL